MKYLNDVNYKDCVGKILKSKNSGDFKIVKELVMDFLNVNLAPIAKIRGKVMDNSILFNKIVNGKGIEDYSKWELVSKINSQYLIAKEEVDEFFTAKENNDIVEMYDGAIDTFYTVPFLVQLLNEYEIRYDTEYDECDGYTLAELDILEQGGVDVLFEATELDLDILSEYADRVIENNMQKFTTSLDEFETWESEYIPTSKFVDGVTYYFFVDENLKVKKRDGFPKVEVGSLFNGAK